MNAVITGGAGFIGSHLAQSLCESGARVTVIDDLSAGSRANLEWRTSGHLFNFVHDSILNTDRMRSLVACADVVFHLAAQTATGITPESLQEAHAVNLDATLSLLHLCREANVERFIFTSTAAVYGLYKGGGGPLDEGTSVCPASTYAAQKLVSEAYARVFSDSGLSTVAIRLSNVFGPRQPFTSPYAGVVAQYCTSFVNDEKPVVVGGGAPLSDFLYICDAVHALQRAAEVPIERVTGRVLNVGSGRAVCLTDLLNILRELTGKELAADFPPAVATCFWSPPLNISAASKALDFNVSVGLFEGVWKTFQFHQQLADSTPAI